jgi:hypothetical protein
MDGQVDAPGSVYLRLCGRGPVTERSWEAPRDLSQDALWSWLAPLTGAGFTSAIVEAVTGPRQVPHLPARGRATVTVPTSWTGYRRTPTRSAAGRPDEVSGS